MTFEWGPNIEFSKPILKFQKLILRPQFQCQNRISNVKVRGYSVQFECQNRFRMSKYIMYRFRQEFECHNRISNINIR